MATLPSISQSKVPKQISDALKSRTPTYNIDTGVYTKGPVQQSTPKAPEGAKIVITIPKKSTGGGSRTPAPISSPSISSPTSASDKLKQQINLVENKNGVNKSGGFKVKNKSFMSIPSSLQRVNTQLDIYSNDAVNSYQDRLNRGEINESQANELLNQDINKKYQELLNQSPKAINELSFQQMIQNKKLSTREQVKLTKENLDTNIKYIQERKQSRATSKEEKVSNILDGFSLIKYNQNLKSIQKQVKNNQKGFLVNQLGNKINRERVITGVILKNNKIASSMEMFLRRSGQNLSGLVFLPKSALRIVKKPSSIVEIPKSVFNDLKDTGKLIITSPLEAIAKVGSDILFLKMTSGGSKIVGEAVGKQKTFLMNKIRGVSQSNGYIKIKSAKQTFIRRGKEVYVKKRVPITRPKIIQKITGRKAGQFVKFQKNQGVVLKKGLLTETSRPLSEQVKFAGKEGTIVTAQANKLVNLFKREKILRKPIPGEDKFTSATKSLLKKFDSGKISNKEFFKLNERVLKESGKTLLERSLYADPTGLVRFTRLGEAVPQASLRDVLRGNFTLKKQKPQIIVFPKGKISNFPKSIKDVVNKLNKNKKLTPMERARLVKYQTKPSGKWKPIGDVEYRGGIELEVTLAPGETIRRVKKLGTASIEGKSIEIVEAKIIKLKSSTKNLLNRAKSGNRLSAKEVNNLRRSLSKETNLKVSARDIKSISKNIRRKPIVNKPLLSIKRLATSKAVQRIITTRSNNIRKLIKSNVRSNTLRKNTFRANTRRVTARINSRVPALRTPTTRTPTTRTPTTRTPTTRTPTNRIPAPRTPTTRTPIPRRYNPPVTVKTKRFSEKVYQQKNKNIKVFGYNVYAKSRGKYIKLNKLPLSKKNALNRGSYATDQTTSRTFFVKPNFNKVKRLGKVTSAEQNYKDRNGIKLREFKIRGKRNIATPSKFIEKRRYLIDTRGEKRGLSIAKLQKRLVKGGR